MNADKTRAHELYINIFKIKLNSFIFWEVTLHIILPHNYAFSMRRSRCKIPVSLCRRNFTYFRIVRSFNKCEFENGSSGKHKRSRTDVVQSNICCYQDIEDCQYQDKRYRMDLDGTSRVVFSWRFFCSALYDFLHFRDALTPAMPLREMTALHHSKIVAHGAADPRTCIGILCSGQENIYLPSYFYLCIHISRGNTMLLQKYVL